MSGTAPRGRRDGFTLIEVLAAFVVLSLVAVVLTRGLVSARYGTASVSETLAAEKVVRSLLEGPIPAALAKPGRKTGRAGDYPWVMTSEAVGLALPKPGDGAPPSFVPVRLTVEVSMPRGRRLAVETVRLVKAPAS